MADFLLVRDSDNTIIKEALGIDDPTDGGTHLPKAGTTWRQWQVVINDTSTTPNKITLPPVRSFSTPGFVIDTITIRNMDAGELDTFKESLVNKEFKTVLSSAFNDIHNALYMLARQSQPTLTKAQFRTAIANFKASVDGFSRQETINYLKSFID